MTGGTAPEPELRARSRRAGGPDADSDVEVVEYTDPLCPWAWGSEPAFRWLRAVLGGRGTWRRAYAILFDSDDDPAPDPAAEAAWYARYIAEVSGHTGAPHAERLDRAALSSWPASPAARAAEAQGAEVAERVLRQIQRLEKHLGARLLDRTPQGTRLTPAGQSFLPRAQALLQAAQQAEPAVREQAETERITIGYVEDLVITAAVRELRRRRPDAEIATRYLSCRDVGALPDNRVDALIARAPLPFAADDVVTTPLYEEPRMLAVPRGHPLADRTSVTAEALAGEEAAPCAFETADWTSYRILGAGVPPVESYEDKLERVASGRAIAVLPVGDRRSSLRPDLVTIPIEDAPPSQVVLVSRKGDPNPMIGNIRLAAKTVLTAPAA